MNELFAVSEWMDEQDILSEIALDYRVKSVDPFLVSTQDIIRIIKLEKFLMTF